MLCSNQWQTVVSKASMQIKWGMRISEGQIIRAILYSKRINHDQC